MRHVSFQTLVDLAQSTLNTANKEKAQQHLATCQRCQKELEELRHLLEGLQAPPLAAPQPDLMKRLVSAFRRQQTQLAQRPLRPATLQFDSWTKFAPSGVRGGTSQEHQLLFAASLFDVDLQIVEDVAAPGVFSLRGQVLALEAEGEPEPDNPEGMELRLADRAGDERRSLTDHLGRFTFSRLTAGQYTLRLLLDDHDVIFESLEVT